MLQVLAELIHSKEKRERSLNPSLEWAALDEGDLQKAFPFWAPVDIRRVQSSLLNLGLIAVDSSASFYAVVDPGDTTEDNRVTRLQSVPSQESAQPREATAMPNSGSASLIAPNWQPSLDWIKKCKQHSIPEEFVHALVPEFVSYWRDRGQARFSAGDRDVGAMAAQRRCGRYIGDFRYQ